MGVDIGVKLLHGHGVRQRCYAPVRIPAARAGGVARRRAVSQMTLMGDTILVEPKVGLRPQLSMVWAEEALKAIFGPSAIN